MSRDRYRLTAALKDETDIVTSITATSIGRAVIMYVATLKTGDIAFSWH
jgi:hypothetical protein